MSDLNNTVVHPPSPEDRNTTTAQASRVLDTLRVVTNNDAQQQMKVLLNILGLLIARNFDNPQDIERIIQGIPMYVNAYRQNRGELV